MANYQHHIDPDISVTYIQSSKKLTLVASLGVTIGIGIFVFLNSMTAGFSRTNNTIIFKSTPHIRVYKDDQMSEPLLHYADSNRLAIIANPKVVPESNRIVDPSRLVELLQHQPDVVLVMPQVAVSVFFNSGKSQLAGSASGVNIDEANGMFDIASTLVEGSLSDLKTTPNGILLGVGVAAKMSVRTNDNISVTSSRNITRVMKVVGLLKSNNSYNDKAKAYISISSAQQLLAESSSYVSDIYVNVTDPAKAPNYSAKFSALTGYKAEDWQAAYANLVSGSRLRDLMILAISISILLVAGFGIYNILNLTISQKINDIAILKAMGFQSQDVIRIFLLQGTIIGMIGIVLGLLLAAVLIYLMSRVYIGKDIGYFPIGFEPATVVYGTLFGLAITLLASYLPARKAANVDPVSIFRK